jgi:hypothetical protein
MMPTKNHNKPLTRIDNRHVIHPAVRRHPELQRVQALLPVHAAKRRPGEGDAQVLHTTQRAGEALQVVQRGTPHSGHVEQQRAVEADEIGADLLWLAGCRGVARDVSTHIHIRVTPR